MPIDYRGYGRSSGTPTVTTMLKDAHSAFALLIIHGTRDTIIPVTDAEALYQASGSATKKLLRIRGADHNNLLAVGLDEYLQAVSNIIKTGTRAETGR